MAPRIFITGVTGYIGGDILYDLYQAHPDYTYAALIRLQDKADQAKKDYPSLEPIIGGLDDYDIIKEQAAKADVVIHTADSSDHEGSAKAIAEGLASGHSKENPGYWLHTSGTGILMYEDVSANKLGESSDHIHNDWSGVEELTSLPDDAFHRNVDKIVLEAASKHIGVVNTAIICPPTIYGIGRGPFNTRSRQTPGLAKVVLTEKCIPILGSGKAKWHEIHVADLSDLYLLLLDAAISKDKTKTDQEQLWGPKGYYLTENGDFFWSDIAKETGKAAAKLGYIPEPEIRKMSYDEVKEAGGMEALTWGLNSRGKGERANRLLGWTPKMPSLVEEIPNIVKDEYARLQKS